MLNVSKANAGKDESIAVYTLLGEFKSKMLVLPNDDGKTQKRFFQKVTVYENQKPDDYPYLILAFVGADSLKYLKFKMSIDPTPALKRKSMDVFFPINDDYYENSFDDITDNPEDEDDDRERRAPVFQGQIPPGSSIGVFEEGEHKFTITLGAYAATRTYDSEEKTIFIEDGESLVILEGAELADFMNDADDKPVEGFWEIIAIKN
jgi:hypothetical protein